MSLLKILIFPDRRLRTVAKPISKIDSSIVDLANNLLETMYSSDGIGLAATQVNIHKRIIAVDTSEEKNRPLILINPLKKNLDKSKSVYEEGCLSVPGFYEPVERNNNVEISFQDVKGEHLIIKPEGLESVVIQHEMDHLDGKVFVDYLSNLKREIIKKKLIKERTKKWK